MSEDRNDYKYAIPRNVKASFQLSGLGLKQILLMIPFVAVAAVIYLLASGPPKFMVPLAIILIGYFSNTQEIDGETIMEMAENLFLDLFRPRVLLWEEEEHDRWYKEYIQTEERRREEISTAQNDFTDRFL